MDMTQARFLPDSTKVPKNFGKCVGAAAMLLLLLGSLIGFSMTHLRHGERTMTALVGATGPEEWIHYSFEPDRTGQEATFVSSRQRIFGDILFEKQGLADSETSFSSSESTSEANTKISATIGIEASYGAFAASASASASRATQSSTRTLRTDCSVKAKKYDVVNNVVGYDKLWDALRPDVKTLIETQTPAMIVNQIGVFFPWKLQLGGVLRSTFIKKMKAGQTSSDFETSVSEKVGFAIASASASESGSFSFGNSHSTDEVHMTVRVLGGDTSKWLYAKDENFEEVRKEWADTVSDARLYPINYEFDFIWNIIKAHDMEKGQAVEDYTRKMWSDELAKLNAADQAAPYAKPILDVCYGSNGAWWMYDDAGTGADTDLRVDQPQPAWCNDAMHYALGDIANVGSHDAPNYHDIPMFNGDTAWPVYASRTWTDAGSGGYHDGTVWWLEAPHGYSCLASVMTNGASPNLHNYVCVPSKCVKYTAGSVAWHDTGSGADHDVTLYHSAVNDNYFYAFGFWSNGRDVRTIDPGCYE